MSVQNRIEEFALAPNDPRWGDERARDEYYRGAALGFWWMQYVVLLVMVVAAAQGAVGASVIALVGLCFAQLVSWSYCRRRGIPIAAVTRDFNKGGRRWIGFGTTMPFIVLWLAFTLRARGSLDGGTVAGAVVGGIVGGLFAVGVGVWMRRSEQRRLDASAAEDDRFD
ncbi:hypothetical protein [Jongsikchunia kroppenstedtii]|uniref:hypothetical protein n=1 Tax=Jongsikchunia kroppenstedtii TaxID=1121721 RepID=UPI00037E11A0|nr:hypothetical protein [Jongsikchunia kroppenstedtii]